MATLLSLRTFSCAALLTLAAVACGSSSSGDDGVATDDVVTSRCPATFAYEHDKPFVFQRTPTKRGDGKALSADEQARVKASMDAAKKLGPETTTLGHLVKRNGTCSYTADSGDTRAVLRTKDGRDRLDISEGDFRIFAFPDSFDKNGVRFGSDAVVNFFANVNGIVRIGKVRVSTPGHPALGPTTLRVPILDESGALVHDTHSEIDKTIVLDGRTGPDKYSALTDKIEKLGLEPMRFGSPNDYETKDPSTSICFNGDEHNVCGLLSDFVDNLLSDMFGIAGDEERGSGCVVTKDNVAVEFFMSESDSTSTGDIPRCK